jgi:universal stress protein A
VLLRWNYRSLDAGPPMTPDIDPNPSSGQSSESRESPGEHPNEHDPMYRRILLPIDFSEHSKRTISYAKRIALRYDSTVYLLHVFQVPDYIVMPYPRQSGYSAEVQAQVSAAEREATEHLEALNRELSDYGIRAEPLLRVGYPFEEIVLMANHYDVDLIVIGSHGRSRITRLLVGSTAQRVVEHARCAVLVVKGPRHGME